MEIFNVVHYKTIEISAKLNYTKITNAEFYFKILKRKGANMKKLPRILGVLDLFLLSNLSPLLNAFNSGYLFMLFSIIVLSAYFLIMNIKPSNIKSLNSRLRIMYNGRELMIIFIYSFILNIISFILWNTVFTIAAGNIVTFAVTTLILGAIVTFNGVARMFVTSKQLGITQRVLIVLLWWCPMVNIFIISKACRTVYDEYMLETDKIELNSIRKENEICKTKYPILMVHGVFFRDLKFFNYWGRVPGELIRNGAEIYYGEQHSAASVERCAYELKAKIEDIVIKTGCEKVNIIAHSKGGLDSRFAISCLGMDKYVATLTTVNTPHRGCEYADFILEHAPFGFKDFLARSYNSALKKFGEEDSDFISAVTDLTAKNCRKLNEIAPDSPNVYYQSVGSKMKKSSSAGFPLNMSYHIVKLFSKLDNDGLVDVESMKWGERYIFFEPKSKRGLSHGDLIDLMREDIKGFDIREEFVGIAADLKNRGF